MQETPTIPLPLKYHGGKNYQANNLIDLMPEHLHYVEPYCGGLAVLLHKNPIGVSEVVNDIHGGLTNFFRVLQSPLHFAEFQRIVSAVPFSQVEWSAAQKTGVFPADPNIIDVEAAVRFFIACRQSRAGTFDSFAPLSKTRIRRQMNEQASAWMSAVDGLPQVAERLKRVVILNKDALDVIRQEDGLQTLFYLDPPYLHETRVAIDTFAFEMTDLQHSQLLEVIKTCKGKVMLSGYHSPLYDQELSDWRCQEFQIDNKASSAKTKPVMTECVWMNY
ncbi:MAG: DNA adenine methylase [Thermoguttaceae bacterium]|jgi:DNA adenine methylase